MSTIKSSDEHLTLNADGSSKDIKFQANGVEKASISSAGAFTSTTIDATKLTGDLPAISGANLTGLSSFDPDGAVTINESSADVDFRVESNSNTHQLFVDGGNSMVMIDQVANPGTRALIGGESNGLQIKGNSNSSSYLGITRHTADGDSPAIKFLKSRNTSVNSYTIVQDNDYLGEIGFHADDGTDYSTRGASIQARVDGTPGTNDMPTKLLFNTTANGANDTTERLAILSDGRGLSQFTAKAWCTWTQVNTHAIGDSHNISSLSDTGVGATTVNFTNNMAQSQYVVNVTGRTGAFGFDSSRAAGNVNVGFRNASDNAEDSANAMCVVFGD